MIYVFSFLKSLQFFGALAVPFYLQRLGFSYTQMFLLEMIFSVCLFLFEVPTGVVADVFGRKTSLFIGSLLFGGGFVLYGFTYSLAVIVLIQVTTAFGFSMISGADRALVYENAKLRGKNDKGAAVTAARYDAAGTAGLLLAFPAGSVFVVSGVLPYTAALGAVFVATGVSIILSGFAILVVTEEKRASRPVNTDGPGSGGEKGGAGGVDGSDCAAGVSRRAVGVSRRAAFRHALEGFLFVFRNRQLRALSLNYATVSALTFLMFWFYQSLLLDNGVSARWNGFVAAGFNAAGMLLLLVSGAVCGKLGTRRTLFLTAFIPGLLYLSVFLFPHELPIVLLAVFGVTALRTFRAPLLTTLMNTQIADENRATVLSGVSMVERILISLFYPLAGILLDVSIRWTFLLTGAALVVAALFLRNPLCNSDNGGSVGGISSF